MLSGEDLRSERTARSRPPLAVAVAVQWQCRPRQTTRRTHVNKSLSRQEANAARDDNETRRTVITSRLPLPLASRAGAGRQPMPAPGLGPARHGPARAVSRRSCRHGGHAGRGNTIRGRDHHSPALPPGPPGPPSRFHSSESAGALGQL